MVRRLLLVGALSLQQLRYAVLTVTRRRSETCHPVH
jgi:hypothetical protein